VEFFWGYLSRPWPVDATRCGFLQHGPHDCGCSVNRHVLAWCLPVSLSVSCGCLMFQPFPSMRHLPSSATSPPRVPLPNVLSTRRPAPMWDVRCASTVWFSAFCLMVVASTMRAETARAGYDCRLALFLEGGTAGAMPTYSPTHYIHSSTGSVLCLHSQHSHRPLHMSPLPFCFYRSLGAALALTATSGLTHLHAR